MLVNAALWIYLGLNDASRLPGASACAYVGLTPERTKEVLDNSDSSDLRYYIELAQQLGFTERDYISVHFQE